MQPRTYIAIDLKSFYASVECVARGLDPLTTNLVVADASRTEKTICLAVSPSLKAYGISGRARLFEVIEQVKRINDQRMMKAPGHVFSGVATQDPEVHRDPSKALGYLIAPPRMAHYIKVSSQIFNIYLKYVSPDDLHIYSVDEVFIDATEYLRIYKTTAHDLAYIGK
jgi:DNA polymerase V